MILKDRVAIVTGAGSGIGRASAEILGHEGAVVIVADIDAAPGPLVVDVVAAVPAGANTSHLHLHVTIDVQPEVQPS